uniref:Uncharacterized protein K02A2.6 n=1 Tax=Cacopsylla melanoneura TaxID=428564 RepID=A0A8D8UQ59_9HEMI
MDRLKAKLDKIVKNKIIEPVSQPKNNEIEISDVHNIYKVDNLLNYEMSREENRESKVREPLLPHELPDRPFQRICLDILNYKNSDYLVIVDAFSKWVECLKLSSKTCHEVISKLKTLFAHFGIPEIIVSDNSPFNSYEINTFAKNYGIQWQTSSPLFPSSNGQSERAVGICKDLLKKADSLKVDFLDLLMEYRATPIASIGVSPSELIMFLKHTSIEFNSNNRQGMVCALPGVDDIWETKLLPVESLVDETVVPLEGPSIVESEEDENLEFNTPLTRSPALDHTYSAPPSSEKKGRRQVPKRKRKIKRPIRFEEYEFD